MAGASAANEPDGPGSGASDDRFAAVMLLFGMPAKRFRTLFENGLILRTKDLRALGLLSPGKTHGRIETQGSSEQTFSVLIASDIVALCDGHLRVWLFSRPDGALAERLLWEGSVAVVGKPLSWNGARVQWLTCPVTGRLCRTLYCPPGANTLAAYRHWPRNVYAHASENRSRFRRTFEHSRRLRSKLAVASEWLEPVPQRHGRQSATQYASIVKAIDEAEMLAMPNLLKLLDQFARARGD